MVQYRVAHKTMGHEDDILSVFHVAIPVSLLVTVTADFHVKWSVQTLHNYWTIKIIIFFFETLMGPDSAVVW